MISVLGWGQSNILNAPAFDWTPPPNLKAWNGSYGTPGTALCTPDPTALPVSHSFASQIAAVYPGEEVNVINIGRGSQSIEQWLPGAIVDATHTDMYAATKAAVEAYLTATGATKIDFALGWQGESDWFDDKGANYVRDWCLVWSRFKNEAWFPRETPTVLMGVSHRSNDISLGRMNHLLRRIADMDPQFRMFCDTRSLGADCWQADGLHASGFGTSVMGRMAFQSLISRPPVNAAKWQTRTTDSTRTKQNTVTPGPDDELRFFLQKGKTYRLKFKIIGITTLEAGFKWSLTGPAATVKAWRTHNISKLNTEIDAANTGSYPTNRTVSSQDYFWLDIDLFVANLTADGEVVFNWSQVTSSPDATRVMATSALDALEICV